MIQTESITDIPTISSKELKQRLDQNGTFEFWNVLTDDYFHGQMIPGSRRVPLDQIGREVHDARLAKDTEVIVYCAGPKCPQSAMAAQKLQTLGLTKVRAFEGGLEEWGNEGFPIEQLVNKATV